MPVIIVQEIKDGWDEWHDFSGDEIAKGGEVFYVYRMMVRSSSRVFI